VTRADDAVARRLIAGSLADRSALRSLGWRSVSQASAVTDEEERVMAARSESVDPPRQLVVCCDGTNNTLTAGTQDTNVLRLVTHFANHASNQRLIYYDPGVGTPDAVPPTDPMDWLQRSWERITGLASGRGVYENICQAYLFLMHNWRDERDRIYCFGFSRGAFTVRCVAGMVNLFGILKPEHEVLLPMLIRIYFSPPGRDGSALRRVTLALHHALRSRPWGVAAAAASPGADGIVTRERLAAQIGELFTTPAGRNAWVHWVGVWDTVESVGLPGPLARSNPSTATLRGKRMRNVRHALAFDEHRWTFEPRLYEEAGDIDDRSSGQTLKQRWFTGVHCDVGGGYPRTDCLLSDEALEWMVAEVADDMGLPVLAPAASSLRIRHDALWDTPWWALAGMCLRDMQPRSADGSPIAVVAHETVPAAAASVWDTRRKAWPLGVALVGAAVCVILSGACLLASGWQGLSSAQGIGDALGAAKAFAGDRWASLWGQGLIAEGHAPWRIAAKAGWSLFWDFGFLVSWGYLLARISSRSFAWLAGIRCATSSLPKWRVLGMAPLLAVFAGACEDLLTLAALAMHGVGAGTMAGVCLFLAGASALGKVVGLIACLPLIALRCWIALPGVPRRRS
jgi:uncharacterized protein (DUF2235 family)